MITETNLDRFDTTCLTWRHPSLSRERLSKLLFLCYRRFLSLRHALHNIKDETSFRSGGCWRGVSGTLPCRCLLDIARGGTPIRCRAASGAADWMASTLFSAYVSVRSASNWLRFHKVCSYRPPRSSFIQCSPAPGPAKSGLMTTDEWDDSHEVL